MDYSEASSSRTSSSRESASPKPQTTRQRGMYEREIEWLQSRDSRIASMRALKENAKEVECTFSPSLRTTTEVVVPSPKDAAPKKGEIQFINRLEHARKQRQEATSPTRTSAQYTGRPTVVKEFNLSFRSRPIRGRTESPTEARLTERKGMERKLSERDISNKVESLYFQGVVKQRERVLREDQQSSKSSVLGAAAPGSISSVFTSHLLPASAGPGLRGSAGTRSPSPPAGFGSSSSRQLSPGPHSAPSSVSIASLSVANTNGVPGGALFSEREGGHIGGAAFQVEQGYLRFYAELQSKAKASPLAHAAAEREQVRENFDDTKDEVIVMIQRLAEKIEERNVLRKKLYLVSNQSSSSTGNLRPQSAKLANALQQRASPVLLSSASASRLQIDSRPRDRQSELSSPPAASQSAFAAATARILASELTLQDALSQIDPLVGDGPFIPVFSSIDLPSVDFTLDLPPSQSSDAAFILDLRIDSLVKHVYLLLDAIMESFHELSPDVQGLFSAAYLKGPAGLESLLALGKTYVSVCAEKRDLHRFEEASGRVVKDKTRKNWSIMWGTLDSAFEAAIECVTASKWSANHSLLLIPIVSRIVVRLTGSWFFRDGFFYPYSLDSWLRSEDVSALNNLLAVWKVSSDLEGFARVRQLLMLSLIELPRLSFSHRSALTRMEDDASPIHLNPLSYSILLTRTRSTELLRTQKQFTQLAAMLTQIADSLVVLTPTLIRPLLFGSHVLPFFDYLEHDLANIESSKERLVSDGLIRIQASAVFVKNLLKNVDGEILLMKQQFERDATPTSMQRRRSVILQRRGSGDSANSEYGGKSVVSFGTANEGTINDLGHFGERDQSAAAIETVDGFFYAKPLADLKKKSILRPSPTSELLWKSLKINTEFFCPRGDIFEVSYFPQGKAYQKMSLDEKKAWPVRDRLSFSDLLEKEGNGIKTLQLPSGCLAGIPELISLIRRKFFDQQKKQ
eukprot:ANDGO_00802.mRNA.1 hypothetical protein